MTTQTVEQINGLPDKALVYGFRGTVKKVFSRNTGEGNHGPWSIQNVILMDEEQREIKMMIKDCPDFFFAPGDGIELEPKLSDKGITGLYAIDDDYKGTITRILKATSTVIMKEPPSNPPKDIPAQSPANHASPARQTRERSPEHLSAVQQSTKNQNSEKTVDPFKDARKTVMKIANLHLLCAKAVSDYEAPAFKEATGRDMSESQIQGATASVFITAERSGLVNKMPCNPIKL